jgi:hypothetical protein
MFEVIGLAAIGVSLHGVYGIWGKSIAELVGGLLLTSLSILAIANKK